MATFSETIQFSFSSFLLQASAQGDFLPTGFFTSGSNRYTIAIRGAHTSRAYPQYQFLFSTGLTLRDVDDFSVTLRWGTTNELVFDFSDYADRTDPYDFRPSDAATRNQLNNLYRWIRAGGRSVSVTLENNPRIVSLGISAQSGTGTGEVEVQESDRAFSWEWDIATAGAETNRWADIGLINDTDDIVIPDDLVRSTDPASFNRIRSRANQLRISLVGDNPRLSPAFENQGGIWIQNASTGENLAVLKNIAAFWNDANNQYRINSDAPFIFSSRSALRTAIRSVGVGGRIRFVLGRPPAGLEIYAATEPGTAGIGLAAPKPGISAQTSPGTGLVNVEKIPDLRIRARSGIGTASANVKPATNLGVTAKSEPSTASANLASQAIKIRARSLAGAAVASVKKPTNLLISAKSEPGTARVKPSAPALKILARSLAGTASASVEDNKGLRISRRSRRGTASANIIAPNLKASAQAESGTARVNLGSPTLKISASGAGGMATLDVRKATSLKASAQTEPGTALINLDSPTLKISAKTQPGTGSALVKEPGISIYGSTSPGAARANLAGPKIKVLAKSLPGEARVKLKSAGFGILARSEAGTVRANLKAPGLKILRRSRRGGGTVQVELFSPTEIKIRAESDPGTARVKTSAPPLRILAESGAGRAMVTLMIPERPRDYVREAKAEGQPVPVLSGVTANPANHSADAGGGIYGVNAVK